MSTGRLPPSSLPTTGFKSARNTSPRLIFFLHIIFSFRLLMLCITAAVPTSRAAAIYLNRISPYLLNQPVCRICPRPPRLKRRALLPFEGIIQTTAGLLQHNVAAVSWESHPDVVLTKPPPLLCLWLGGSIIIPLHISWRIGCHTDFWNCSCSLGCEFVSRIINSAHRLPTKRRACPI